MSRLIIFLFLFVSFLSSFGQNEKNIWYFGEEAGLDFSTNPPTPLTNGSINSQGLEGVSSISDLNGNILMYTNGETLWDKSHNIMSNGTGLFGSTTSVQSSIIVPLPGSYNSSIKRFDFYYVFTIDDHNSVGVSYSIVDMTLNGGLGAVTTKNINVIPNGGKERIAVARHANKCDYWVILSPRGTNNQLNSYLLSDTGLTSIPIISTVTATSDPYGALKVSPNNKMLAMADGDILGVYSLNDTTGQLTDKLIYAQSNGPQAYGVEFSPNSAFVYTSGFPGARIKQFDLTTTNNTDFINSEIVVGGISGNMINGSLQLANNGKIYFAPASFMSGRHGSLSVINNPNISGLGANFTANSQNLAGKVTHWGLPHFAPHFEKDTTSIVIDYQCGEDSVFFSLDSIPFSLESVVWSIRHESSPLTVYKDTTAFEFPFQVNLSGKYFVFAELNYRCHTDSIYDTLVAVSVQSFSIGDDTTICQTDSIILDAGSGFDSYLWSDGTTNQTLEVRNSGLFWCEITTNSGACVFRDSINVNFDVSNFNAIITTDSVTCFNGLSGEINITTNGIPYLFSLDGSPFSRDSSFKNLAAGLYNLSIQDPNGCSIDSIIELLEPDSLYLNLDSFNLPTCNGSCDGEIWINGVGGNEPYDYFQNNLFTPINSHYTNICDSTTTTYYVRDKNGCYDSLTVVFDTIKPLELEPFFTDTCIESCVLVGGTPQHGQSDILYHWSSSLASTDSTLLVEPNSDTLINLYATDSNNCRSNMVTMEVNLIPNATISASRNEICLGESISFNVTHANTVTLQKCLWILGDGSQLVECGNVTYEYNQEGSYTVSYITQTDKGCNDTVTQTNIVTVNETPSASFDYSPDNPLAGQPIDFNNTSQLNDINEWTVNGSVISSDIDINSTFNSDRIEVCLRVENLAGCEAISCDSISISSLNHLYIPNTFTPNLDGVNDRFNVSFFGNEIESYNLLIFNRWGELIFSSDLIDKPWDGTHNNTICPTDTYIWKIKASFSGNDGVEVINKVGHVNLLR